MTAEEAPVAHRSWWRTAVPDVAIPYGVTRLLLLAIGWFSQFLPFNAGYPLQDAVARGWHFSPYRLLDIWGRWDTGWYLNIAQHGYRISSEGGQNNISFFPLYPALTSLLLKGVPDQWETPGVALLMAVVVSNIMLIASLFLLHRLALHLFSDRASAQRTIWYICAFPSSFYLSAAYSDSTLLFFLVGATLAAEHRRWLWAGILGAVAAIARSPGIFVIIPIAWAYYQQQPERGVRRLTPASLSLVLLPLLALLGYLAALSLITQNLLEPYLSGAAWGRSASGPWETLIRPDGYNVLVTPIEQLFIVGAFGLAVAVLRRFTNRGYGILIIALLLLPLISGTLAGMIRYFLMFFPLFLLLAHWGRQPVVDRCLMTLFLMLQALLMIAWCQFYFVA